MNKCPSCNREHALVFSFSGNKNSCMYCSYTARLDSSLYHYLKKKSLHWLVELKSIAEFGESAKTVYVLKRNGILFGYIAEIYNGEVYLENYNNDSDGLEELKSVLSDFFGLHYLKLGVENG